MRNGLGVIVLFMGWALITTPTLAVDYGTNPVKSFRDCKNCPEMVVIPAGSITLRKKTMAGIISGESLVEDEDKRISINSFSLGRTEVTQGQWRAVMGDSPSTFNRCGDTCPVEGVSWGAVQEYIEKLSTMTGKQYRLPSEAEWMYACNAGVEEQYCGNESDDAVAWFRDNSNNSTHPVATKQANHWGLYDMSGNVFEWLDDDWHKNVIDMPSKGESWKGDERFHVVRGGAFNDSSRHVTSTNRNYYKSSTRENNVGFRLAMTGSSSVSSDKPMATELLGMPRQTSRIVDPIAQRILDLQNLKKDGIITEEEYQKKRLQLLEKM